MQKYLNPFLIIIGTFIAGMILVGTWNSCNKPASIVADKDTVWAPADTQAIYNNLKATIKPEFKIKIIRIPGRQPDIDSLYAEAKRYWESKYPAPDSGKDVQQIYYAESDSTYENDQLKALVRFYSPIPLHPASYFDFNYELKELHIKHTGIVEVEKKKTFWQRFHISAFTGPGIGIFKKEFDINVGLGFSFDFL